MLGWASSIEILWRIWWECMCLWRFCLCFCKATEFYQSSITFYINYFTWHFLVFWILNTCENLFIYPMRRPGLNFLLQSYFCRQVYFCGPPSQLRSSSHRCSVCGGSQFQLLASASLRLWIQFLYYHENTNNP